MRKRQRDAVLRAIGGPDVDTPAVPTDERDVPVHAPHEFGRRFEIALECLHLRTKVPDEFADGEAMGITLRNVPPLELLALVKFAKRVRVRTYLYEDQYLPVARSKVASILGCRLATGSVAAAIVEVTDDGVLWIE